jgi:hypothetical protein
MTVSAVNTDGTGIRVLHTFIAPYVTYGGTNTDGAFPHDAPPCPKPATVLVNLL